MLAFSNTSATSLRTDITFRLALLYNPRVPRMCIAGPNELRDNGPCSNWHGRADAVGPRSVITGRDNTSPPPLFGVGADDERNVVVKAVVKCFNRRKKGIEITMNDDTGADIALTGTFHHMVTTLPGCLNLMWRFSSTKGSAQG